MNITQTKNNKATILTKLWWLANLAYLQLWQISQSSVSAQCYHQPQEKEHRKSNQNCLIHPTAGQKLIMHHIIINATPYQKEMLKSLQSNESNQRNHGDSKFISILQSNKVGLPSKKLREIKKKLAFSSGTSKSVSTYNSPKKELRRKT